MRLLSPLLLAFALASGPAFAAEPPVGEAVAHEGAEAEHEIRFTDDDDHDGIANWRDADSEGYEVVKLANHALNLLIFLGVVGFFARRPIMDALGDRALEIRRGITDASAAKAAAEEKYSAIQSRIDAFEAEVAKMRADAEAAAADEERRLIAKAEDEADRIALNAERNIRDEVTRARVALRKDAIDLAVKLAEQTLKSKVQPDDQRRLARAFLDSLKDQGASHGG
jgi:F-type H+-transporting ATPase subunit b